MRGSMVELLTFVCTGLVPFLLTFFSLKLPIIPFSFSYNLILKYLEKKNDLIIRLFNIIVHYMNELDRAKSFTSLVAHGAGAYLRFL